MRRIPLDSPFFEIRKPSAEAVERLSAHWEKIRREWRRQLRRFGLGKEALGVLADLNLPAIGRELRHGRTQAIRKSLHGLGKDLARRGANVADAANAQAVLFEICLPYLTTDPAILDAPAVAAARIQNMGGALLASGYAEQQEAQRLETEAKLGELKHRLHATADMTQTYERERRQLSQDLHDDIGHDLVMLKLYLELVAQDARKAGAQPLDPRLQESLTLVTHAMESVRRMIFNLGPAILEDMGFAPAIQFFARQFSARTGIPLNVEIESLPEDLPYSHQVAMYRVLQGALSNVAKHARAKNVRVALQGTRDAVVVMMIEDDGAGFDVAAVPRQRRYGLTTMRERIEALGGKLHIESSLARPPGRKHGTRIEVDLPLPEEGTA